MYKVDGFLFEDEAIAEIAKKEEEGIRFIKERTAIQNPEVALKLYKKFLSKFLPNSRNPLKGLAFQRIFCFLLWKSLWRMWITLH